MATPTKTPSLTKVITGTVRLSYAHLFKPSRMNETGKDKYSVALLIDKTDAKTLEACQKAIAEAERQWLEKFGKGKKTVPANFKRPLRDGDVERTENEEYKGKMFVNASSDQKPGIVDRNAQPITDESEVYSGCYARVSVNFYPFNVSGSAGVACGLNHVQKVRDGEVLAGRSRAEDDFTPIEDDGQDLI